MEQYFAELDNPIRIKILQILQLEELSLSKLTKKIGDISNSEISRHLSRLMEKNIIQKDKNSSRNYQLTEFGATIMKLLHPLIFVFEHDEYFQSHSLNILPEHLQHQIHLLKNSTIIKGTGNVMVEFKEFTELPSKKLKVMVDSPFPFGSENADVDYIVPKEMKKMKPEFGDMGERTFRFKFYTSTPISIALSDLGMGYITFPRIGEVRSDYQAAFKVEDKRGFEFLQQIWEYYWKQGSEYILINKNNPPPEF